MWNNCERMHTAKTLQENKLLGKSEKEIFISSEAAY